MSRKALVNNSTGLVVNVIEHENDSDWSIPDDHSLINAVDKGGPGDTWDGNSFISVTRDPPSANDVRKDELEDKARKDQPMTTAELREMYKLRFLT